ncbi:hypothetical protein Hanom_Chr14g01325481 [Helianthus anomalus]
MGSVPTGTEPVPEPKVPKLLVPKISKSRYRYRYQYLRVKTGIENIPGSVNLVSVPGTICSSLML